MVDQFKKAIAAIKSAIKVRPGIQDVESVVKSTPIAALATGANALIYTVANVNWGSAAFLIFWCAFTLALCVMLVNMSRKAATKKIGRISERGARRLVQTCFVFALPWAILPLYEIGFVAGGDKIVVVMVCVGMLTGGAFLLQRTLVAAVAYMGTILGALIFSVHFGGWPYAWATTAYACVYGVFLAYFSYISGETSRLKDVSVTALSEVLDNLRVANDENYRLANIDTATGLLNRKAFSAKLDSAINPKAGVKGFALLMLDLDRFKNVNDLYGHGVGDALLAETARRINATVSSTDVVARLGGDEFAILRAGSWSEEDLLDIGKQLLSALAEPFEIEGKLIQSGTSVGVAVFPEHDNDPAGLLVKADVALAHAKHQGRGRVALFDAALQSRMRERDGLEKELRASLDQNALLVEYQPIVNLFDARVIGAEALIRLQKEDGGFANATELLSVAAERGLLPDLTQYIVNTVTSDIVQLRDMHDWSGKISINVHPDSLKSSSYLADIIANAEARGLSNRDVSWEVTEDCLAGRGTDQVFKTLRALSARGYDIVLTDFGSGQSSWSQLKNIQLSAIKIDRSFVDGVRASKQDQAIIASIADLSHRLGINCVAKGIESEVQRCLLHALGVRAGQGEVWSPPQSAEDLGKSFHSLRSKAG